MAYLLQIPFLSASSKPINSSLFASYNGINLIEIQIGTSLNARQQYFPPMFTKNFRKTEFLLLTFILTRTSTPSTCSYFIFYVLPCIFMYSNKNRPAMCDVPHFWRLTPVVTRQLYTYFFIKNSETVVWEL